ncbi:MAG: type II secretion system protein [Myxococcales bacterium]|nr:type II secretion system protein [Myxococcales bacterium]
MTRAQRDGFTLVEAVIALAIVAGMLAPAFAIISNSLQSARGGCAETQVLLYAQGVMEEVMALDFSGISVGTANLSYVGEFQTYSGTTTIATYDCDGDGTPDADCKSVTVQIGDVTLQTLRTSY